LNRQEVVQTALCFSVSSLLCVTLFKNLFVDLLLIFIFFGQATYCKPTNTAENLGPQTFPKQEQQPGSATRLLNSNVRGQAHPASYARKH
jgi:hypothetical protein